MSIPFNARDAELLELSGQLKSKMAFVRPEKKPEFLYHYTNSLGLLGILNTSTMWATDYRFLNDSSEIQYGVNLFLEVADEFSKNTNNSVILRFIEILKTTANPYDGMLNCFIACLCEKNNLLSQWREYAAQGGGFALSLETRWIEFIKPGKEKTVNDEYFLIKVLYEREEQRNILKEIIEKTIVVLEEATVGVSVDDAISIIARCSHFISQETAIYLAAFKDPCFDVEQEWRLLHLVYSDNDSHIKIRNGAYGLTPYVELDLKRGVGPRHEKLPIHEIIHGPTNDPVNTKIVLGKLLKSKGYSYHTQINGSNLPVRKV